MIDPSTIGALTLPAMGSRPPPLPHCLSPLTFFARAVPRASPRETPETQLYALLSHMSRPHLAPAPFLVTRHAAQPPTPRADLASARGAKSPFGIPLYTLSVEKLADLSPNVSYPLSLSGWLYHQAFPCRLCYTPTSKCRQMPRHGAHAVRLGQCASRSARCDAALGTRYRSLSCTATGRHSFELEDGH